MGFYKKIKKGEDLHEYTIRRLNEIKAFVTELMYSKGFTLSNIEEAKSTLSTYLTFTNPEFDLYYNIRVSDHCCNLLRVRENIHLDDIKMSKADIRKRIRPFILSESKFISKDLGVKELSEQDILRMLNINTIITNKWFIKKNTLERFAKKVKIIGFARTSKNGKRMYKVKVNELVPKKIYL